MRQALSHLAPKHTLHFTFLPSPDTVNGSVCRGLLCKHCAAISSDVAVRASPAPAKTPAFRSLLSPPFPSLSVWKKQLAAFQKDPPD